MFVFAAAALAIALPGGDIVCPMMGSAVNKDSKPAEIAGAAYRFCCAGCDKSFAKDPKAAVTAAAKKGQVVGEFLFDVTTGKRILAKNAKGTADYNGIRYYFADKASVETFKKNAKKLTAVPKKETLFCGVMSKAVKSHSKADSYVDFEGARYFSCCATCTTVMAKNPGKYAKKAASKLVDSKMSSGK